MRVVQFGEGNFLRTFVDAYFDTLNKEGLADIKVNIIKPIPFGSLENFRIQKNKYHIVLRGKKDGKDVEDVYKIDSLERAIEPLLDMDLYYSLAIDPELKILVSNTTEAGIQYNEKDDFDGFENITYPAKLTKFLFKRFKAGLRGIYLLPVELIENNADELYKCVDKYISLWNLGEDFRKWNDTENFYCNTLVDRIVSGFPKDEATKEHLTTLIGEKDLLMSIGEPFGLWVIQDKGEIKSLLKDGHHNIDVIFTPDISYYKKRKVRVLNGSHTNMVPVSLWMGKETVYDAMNDEKILRFVNDTLTNDIIPFVSDDINATRAFADDVIERFFNPFLNHQLTSIALNSISKWKARDLCSFSDYYQKNHAIPRYLTIGFAYLVNMYMHIEQVGDKFICHLPSRDIEVRDDMQYLTFFSSGKSVHDLLTDVSTWGMDLTTFDKFEETVNEYLKLIKEGKELI